MTQVIHAHSVTAIVMLISVTGSSVLGAEPIFGNVTEAAGLGGGSLVAWADYDNDGHIDVVTGGKLFHNNGDGTFTPVESFQAGSNGVWGDFDNDGKLDFYGTGGGGTLLRNQGNNEFDTVPIPENSHKMSRAAAWGSICSSPITKFGQHEHFPT